MKKLLIPTDAFLPRWDGIARFLAEVIPKIKDEFDITVIAPRFPQFKHHVDNPDGYKIVRAKTHNWTFGDYYAPKFSNWRLVKRYVETADIVWVQSTMPLGMLGIRYAKKFGKPCIAYTHVIDWEIVLKSLKVFLPVKFLMSWLAKLYTKYCYNRCNLLLVPSIETAKIFESAGIKTPKSVVHLGVDTEKFCPPDNKITAKIRLGLKPNMKVIGYVGRTGHEKDLITLYRAFVQLQKRRKDVVLLIVGPKSPDTKVFEDKKNIVVTGQKDDVVPYLQAMDIYVLPSLTETTSLTTLEAMACGLAVVSTKVGFVKDYIKDKYNGILFPQRNSFSLRKKLERLLDNERIREKLGANARKFVTLNFSWSNTIKDIKEVLSRF
ncbi:glycosyltransferase family 4 protein [Candidatus Woesearchaeota archaeon]|nr:glycosyltransferase family 4 protein [Candidatus Woesearchaeota archaeon]MBW3021870.1 glycosyltransferase family 4 protein [Candidatus Woesearchaeota archaeon]